MKFRVNFIIKILAFICLCVGFWLFTFHYLEKIMHTQSANKDYSVVLRKIFITFPQNSETIMPNLLKSFADKNGFALRLVPQLEKSKKLHVQLYRSDIKLIGEQDNVDNALKLNVYSTFLRGVPEANVNDGVGEFKSTMVSHRGVQYEEIKLNVIEDDQQKMPRFHSLRNAEFSVPKGMYNQVRQRVAEFAEKNEFAIKYVRATPDPDEISVSLYKDNIRINLDTLFPVNEVRVACYQLN
jgi:hypothetical protein